LMPLPDRLLAPGGSRDDAQDRLLLVEAKRQSLEKSLVSYIPEPVSQAIALLKYEKYIVAASFTP
jgi:hypothetical protein